MRFDSIKEFSVEELDLDEGNYRFTAAEDQMDCVRKIHNSNPTYFRGLMRSIAEDDLGEPLLVYASDGKNIVADGNRRLAALKVLYSDKFAPTDTVKEFAITLRNEHRLDFEQIQAQVSSDKKLISKTVFERHSSGKTGTSRIPWTAYAAARFGYDEKIGDGKEWHIIALLSSVEEKYPELTEFLDSSEFSYEVFRRIVRAAISNGKISSNIFSERGERIKKTARADLISDAIAKTKAFLEAMERRVLTLSRKGAGYADAVNIETYLKEFSLSPDNQELEYAKNGASDETKGGAGDTTSKDIGDDSSEDGGEHYLEDHDDNSSDESEDRDQQSGSQRRKGNGINRSVDIEYAIAKSKSKKLAGLYNSLCIVSLNEHPALMYVGAWSFFEVLSKLMGNSGDAFPSFFKNKMNGYGVEKQVAKDCGQALEDISKYGNATKHSKNRTPMTATQLVNDFEVLEPLILASLKHHINSPTVSQ